MAITSTKLMYWTDRLESYRPITADIFLTDYCNNRCSYCRYGHESGGYMRFDDFVKYAQRLKDLGVKGFILTGGGEPTINPDFDRITEWLEKNNYDYGINTNFVRYTECEPRFLKVSIDAGDSEYYKATRGVNKFNVVVGNVKRFIEYKKDSRLKTKVVVQCLAQSKSQAESFYQFFSKMDIDTIQFRPIESRQSVDMGEKYKEMVKYISVIAQTDKRVGKSFKFDMVGRMFSSCFAQWTVMCVRHDGQVLYCCHRPNDVVGHILDLDILKKKERYKVDMRQCDTPCRLSGPNVYLEEYRKETDINFV